MTMMNHQVPDSKRKCSRRRAQIDKLIINCENAFKHWDKLIAKSKERDKAIYSECQNR
eukprot:UN01193